MIVEKPAKGLLAKLVRDAREAPGDHRHGLGLGFSFQDLRLAQVAKKGFKFVIYPLKGPPQHPVYSPIAPPLKLQPLNLSPQAPKAYKAKNFATYWVAVEELKLSYHNGYIYSK